MQIILLSGGSGKRLWPLSNDIRSKQFLKLLKTPEGSYESMVQRIARQIKESKIEADITIATSETQYDAIVNQLGKSVDIVTEPERRDTFPAIALSASYLIKAKKYDPNEVVVVMPSDSFIDSDYFKTIAKMGEAVQSGAVDMVLMGITPTEPSTKFGYIVPNQGNGQELITVNRFTEKPDEATAKELITQGAVWNGGVFAFKLSYIAEIIEKYIKADSFEEIRSRYSEFKKISFDYEVVEKATSIGLVPYSGTWSDLGTWNSLTQKIEDNQIGNVVSGEDCTNNHVINELDTPIICLGVSDLIVAASPDGVLVSTKEASVVDLKGYADKIVSTPRFEERSWGTSRVLGREESATTRQLVVEAGLTLSEVSKCKKVLIFIDGAGKLTVNGLVAEVCRGGVRQIEVEDNYTIEAESKLQVIEVELPIPDADKVK